MGEKLRKRLRGCCRTHHLARHFVVMHCCCYGALLALLLISQSTAGIDARTKARAQLFTSPDNLLDRDGAQSSLALPESSSKLRISVGESWNAPHAQLWL